MSKLKESTFVCIDCESTGLDTKQDRIVEVAVTSFTFTAPIDSFDSLIDPERDIPANVIAVHHITPEMVAGKPKIKEVLPEVLRIIGKHPIVGHGVQFDIDLIDQACQRHHIPCSITKNITFDTLRLARLYGDSPSNSLEQLRKHFNIEEEGAHRAMSDVTVNIQVFKKLAHQYHTIRDLQQVLSKPIAMKFMPLGKHKGRLLKEVPIDYLYWASKQEFDQDLLYSLRSEISRRKKGNSFSDSSNPFTQL